MQEIYISEEESTLLMKRWLECRSDKYRERHVVDYGLELYLSDKGKQQLHEIVENINVCENITEAIMNCFECRKRSEFVDAEPYLAVSQYLFAKRLIDALSDYDFKSFCSVISKCFRCVPTGVNKPKYIQYQPLLEACDKVKLKDGYLLDFVDVPADWEGTLAYTRKAHDKPIPCTKKHPRGDSIVKMLSPEGYYKAFPLNERPSEACLRTLHKVKTRRMFNGYKVASPNNEGNPFEGLAFEKSGSGFFQFALFHNTVQGVNRAEYDPLEQTSYVFSRKYLDEILEKLVKNDLGSEISTEDLAQLRNIDLRPRVTIEGDSGEVYNVVFSHHGGFYYQYSHITWPNLMNRVEIKKIVSYDCGLTSGPY